MQVHQIRTNRSTANNEKLHQFVTALSHFYHTVAINCGWLFSNSKIRELEVKERCDNKKMCKVMNELNIP